MNLMQYGQEKIFIAKIFIDFSVVGISIFNTNLEEA